MTTAVILQSSYVPWRGVFDLMARSDVFVFYDEVQYTKRDWRNRNRVVGAQGPRWLTIPVEQAGRYDQTIEETRIADPSWADKHLSTLRHAYARTDGFAGLFPLLERLYAEAAGEPYLATVNRAFLMGVARHLGIETRFVSSSDVPGPSGQTERLVGLCEALGATAYLSGPSARSYLDEALFREAGIDVAWMRYPDYPAYEQPGGYEPAVSVLDALMRAPDADHLMRRAPCAR